MKKKLAWLLIVTMIWGSLPLSVSAEHSTPGVSPAERPRFQMPVETITASSDDPIQGPALNDTYRLLLTWDRPRYEPASIDTRALLEGENQGHDPWYLYAQGYEIEYRNASKSQSNYTFNENFIPPVSQAQGSGLDSRQIRDYLFNHALDRGSLYEIRVTPWHNNNYRIRNPNVTDPQDPAYWMVAPERAPMQTGITPRSVIFMTDIEVNAVGVGDTLLVTWDNPTWFDDDIFDGWQISYKVVEENNPKVGTQNMRPVPMNSPLITRNLDGTLSYTITDNRLTPGHAYIVRVEPTISGRAARDSRTVTINGRVYSFAYRHMNAYEYRTVNPARVSLRLRWEMEGKDYIRLYWSRLAGVPDLWNIDRIDIEEWQYDSVDEDTVESGKRVGVIGIITGEEMIMAINDWRINIRDTPKIPRAYRLAIYDKNNPVPIRSNIVYFDPEYTEFGPYKPEIFDVTANPEHKALMPSRFLAFLRDAYTEVEEGMRDPLYYPGNPQFIDKAMSYEIYVADSMAVLDKAIRPWGTVNASGLTLEPYFPVDPVTGTINQNNYYPSYLMTAPINNYWGTGADGAVTFYNELHENKVYYIKMIGIRDSGQASNPAYFTVYMPPYGPIVVKPYMMAAPPLRAKEVTDKAITVEWYLKYLEILRPDPRGNPDDDTWHAVVGIDKNKNLIYGKSAMDIPEGTQGFTLNELIRGGGDRPSSIFTRLVDLDTRNPVMVNQLLSEAAGIVAGRLNQLGWAGSANDLDLRVIDLTNAQYETHTVGYSFMMAEGGYEAYRQYYLDDEGYPANALNWKKAQVKESDKLGMVECTITAADAPPELAGNLKGNTSYVIYLRPYEVTGHKQAYFPNYVMATTADVKPPIVIDPTTPVIMEDPPHTDTTAKVKWLLQDGLKYDLSYAERLAEYPDGGIALTWEDMQALADPPLKKKGADGRDYWHFTIPNLFPDTSYYVWLRSRVDNPDGEAISSWSNPIEVRTKDIIAPLPPTGLGPASKDHIDLYNRLNKTDYSPREPYALSISWNRDIHDRDTPPAKDGTAEGGNVSVLSLAELTRMYITRFEGLNANKEYAIRAKTVLTVSRAKSGTIEKVYNYIVQVAPDDSFKDAVQFTIPPLNPVTITDPYNFKRKESDWTTVLYLDTNITSDEFDGDKNPEQYPLPEQDWDITYDPASQTFAFRFRTNQIGSDGRRDQNVDQRFITRLIQNQASEYTIDLSAYRNYPITNRIAELPYSILRAFDERRITLDIKASDMTLSIPPGAFNTAAVRALPMSLDTFIRVSLNTNPADMPTLPINNRHVILPKKLTVQAVTPSRSVNVGTFNRPLTVVLPMDDRITPSGSDTALYFSSPNTGGWQDLKGQYSFDTNTLRANTSLAGTLTAVSRDTPPALIPNDPSQNAMQRVASRITISDLYQYNPSETVTANRFNNLVAAVAYNRSTAAINAPLPAADSQALSKARLLAPNDLNRESAIHSLVALYELKTKRVIRPITLPNALPGYSNTADAYKASALKAADIGFISGPFNPKGSLTMGDFMIMLDIIMQDAGL